MFNCLFFFAPYHLTADLRTSVNEFACLSHVVLLEDIAALTGLVFAFAGVGLTVVTHNPIWDAIGTLAIGLLLVAVAIILGIVSIALQVKTSPSYKV